MKNFESNYHGKGLAYSAPSTKVIYIAVRNSILQDSLFTDSNPEEDV